MGYLNEALELHRRTLEMEQSTERAFDSRELRARLLSGGSGPIASPLEGLSEALEISRKMQRNGR